MLLGDPGIATVSASWAHPIGGDIKGPGRKVWPKNLIFKVSNFQSFKGESLKLNSFKLKSFNFQNLDFQNLDLSKQNDYPLPALPMLRVSLLGGMRLISRRCHRSAFWGVSPFDWRRTNVRVEHLRVMWRTNGGGIGSRQNALTQKFQNEKFQNEKFQISKTSVFKMWICIKKSIDPIPVLPMFRVPLLGQTDH